MTRARRAGKLARAPDADPGDRKVLQQDHGGSRFRHSQRAPGDVGLTIKEYFSSQRSETAYWPDDDEVRGELGTMPVYRKLSRARVRMVLESIEDHWRGWIPGQVSAQACGSGEAAMPSNTSCLKPGRSTGRSRRASGSGPRCANPQTRQPDAADEASSTEPSPTAHGSGEGGKASHLQEKDVVLLNSKLLKEYSAKQWDEGGVDRPNLSDD